MPLPIPRNVCHVCLRRFRAGHPLRCRDPRSAATRNQMLRSARFNLRDVGAERAADYVQRAIKSAEGALHHMNRLAGRHPRA